MKPLHIALSAGLAVALAGCQPKESAKPAAEAPAPAAAPAATAPSAVAPEATAALKRMSAYLATLQAFEVKGEATIEQVMDDGQKSTVKAATHYLVHKPDGFVIDVSSDQKVRKFVYDGKALTISAPKLGYYATVQAPPTIAETLDLASDKYGVTLPLVDLFQWSNPARARFDDLKAGTVVGPATIDGVECDQYAFKEGGIDWQIWIERGDKPVPRQVEIVDSVDPAHPAFVSKLQWNLAPTLTATSFAFTAPKGAKAIQMAAAK